MSEFFPDKFTPLERTIVGEAAALLALLGGRSLSVGQLYIEYRQTATASAYDGFVAALTLLYGAGALDYEDQMVRIA
ncbi:ABC-three component system middle component 6 [Microbacterium sp. YJN-G]|uniref:ABC-three component system middle component 6 n=1 Tax=Microbacterium sp. YJN-G TaxID=2763257 RepID=UPI00187764D2|nr:ABC-three component system middle component 6 [Microbacterium sp. YJN-G]